MPKNSFHRTQNNKLSNLFFIEQSRRQQQEQGKNSPVFSLKNQALSSSKSNKKVEATLLISLIIFGYVIEAKAYQRKLVKQKEKTKKPLSPSTRESICAKPSVTLVNKPNNITLGAARGKEYPLPCVEEPPKMRACTEQLNQLVSFHKRPTRNLHSEKLNKQRKEFKRKYSEWLEGINSVLQDMGNYSLNSEEKQKIDNFVMILETLQKVLLYKKGAKTSGVGQCGEATYGALEKLLIEKLKDDLDLTLHLVSLGKTGDNHTFLSLNGNLMDVEIVNNSNAVREYLENFQGHICDPWNNIDGPMDKNHPKFSYYTFHGGCESITVTKMETSLNILDSLPSAIRQELCQEFESLIKQLHLPFDTQQARIHCKMWQEHPNKVIKPLEKNAPIL